MTLVSVDVEADGAYPPDYSMVSFGAIVVEPELNRTFYGTTKPISTLWNPEALRVSGTTRDMHMRFAEPEQTMKEFAIWLRQIERPVFISDNPAFDWQWINYYFHKFYGSNPFGFSARRIGDLYCGMQKDLRANKDWKKFRVTPHTHNPLEDARGNAEAILKFKELGLK